MGTIMHPQPTGQAGRNGRPAIGIPVPTSFDMEYNGRFWSDYARAVSMAGGHPVHVPLSASSRTPLLRGCAGFVLPGSPADVGPELYGQRVEAGTGRRDVPREECDRDILAWAERTGAPILGICFGLQSVNVLQGGTLVQDLQPIPVNHAASAQVGVAHGVGVVSRSLLGSLLSSAEAPVHGEYRRLAVNSSHHQAISIAGEGLAVVARSMEDGIVEAAEGKLGRAPVIGVQWHPERSVDGSAASRALFLWLVMAAMDASSFADEGNR